MTANLDPTQAEAVAQAEQQKQAAGATTVGDIVSGVAEAGVDIVGSGIAEIVVGAVGATIEGTGVVLFVVGETVGAIIAGTLEGL